MELADALIGASAAVKQMPLLTGNEKHYRHLPDMAIQRFMIG
jgi:predicted nucleic acid-binding protein